MDDELPYAEGERVPRGAAEPSYPRAEPGPPPETSPHDQLRNALELAQAIRRHFWLVGVVTGCALAATAAWTLRQPKIYLATATVLINNRLPATFDKVGEVLTPEYFGDNERFVNSQVRLLQSREMADRVARRLSLPDGALVGRLQVQIEKISQMASLSVEDTDPETAQRLANTFKDCYVTASILDRTNASEASARFLDAQTHTLRNELEADERALYEFQKDHELPGSNFEESHKIQSSNLSALHVQHAQARAAGVKLRALLQEVDAAGVDRALLRTLALDEAGTRWDTLRAQHVSLAEQLTQLESRYGAMHPKLQETRQALATVDRELDHDVDLAVAAVRARARANGSEQAQLKAAIADETRKAVQLRQAELDYNRLKRSRDEDRDAYEMVARRLKETQLQALVRQTYVRPLDAAVRPLLPVRPSLRRNLSVGLLVGFLVGMLLALLLEVADDTVRSPRDVERRLAQPLLGVMMSIPVPAEVGSDEQGIEIARAQHIVQFPRSQIAEQCHSVSTNLFAQFLERLPRAILVTSATVDDGKTLVSVNLATTVAARGKRVLLVDADLRRGRLHRLFKVTRGGGLFELATARISIDEAVRQSSIPNVDVITTGEMPDKVSPLRIFELAEFPRVIQGLAERYDLVVFDTAPVSLVSDALVLAPLTEGVVGVVRAGKTSWRAARDIGQKLAVGHVSLVGWVLNDISEAELKSGYYRGYGHAYGGYGYYHEQSDTPS
jgi:capsular exopolysaccharide synthesis family protein